MNKYERKYQKILEILPDVAECLNQKLILVGGTALALFYLQHRTSVDLDFVPVDGDDAALKRELKGCLSHHNYNTKATRFTNQFVIQFEDTSIKIEIFSPERKIGKTIEYDISGFKIKVASLEDLLKMKLDAYRERKEARDLFDIFCIMRQNRDTSKVIEKLVAENGKPIHLKELEGMIIDTERFEEFQKEVLT